MFAAPDGVDQQNGVSGVRGGHPDPAIHTHHTLKLESGAEGLQNGAGLGQQPGWVERD